MSKIILVLTLWTGGPSIPVHTLEFIPEGVRVTGILTDESRVFSEDEYIALMGKIWFKPYGHYDIVRQKIEPLPDLPQR